MRILLLTLSVLAWAMPAFTDETRYVGPSSDATLDGGEGLFVYHRACAATYGDAANWCTSQMIIEGGPAPGAPSPIPGGISGGVWVQPVIATRAGATGGREVREFSGFPYFSDIEINFLNCDGWGSAFSKVTGMVMREGPFADGDLGVEFALGSCEVPRPAACCAPVPVAEPSASLALPLGTAWLAGLAAMKGGA